MFYSGNYASFASLKSSVEAALQLNGWTLSDDILSKNGMFLKLTASATHLLLTAGTGGSAGALAGIAPNGAKIMSYESSPMNFPGQYDLHIFNDTDEVYLIVNYNADRYQQLSWGKSNVQQIGGTGMWFSGSFREAASPVLSQTHPPALTATANQLGFNWNDSYGGMGCGLFFENSDASQNRACSYINTGLDSVAWRRVGTGDGQLFSSGDGVAALLQALPSAYNQNTVLLPLQVPQRRLSNGLTVVADMVHARLCRNDNHLSGEIVSYGGDDWKVYPFYRKNADARNGGAVYTPTPTNHSGTFAFAIRYTG